MDEFHPKMAWFAKRSAEYDPDDEDGQTAEDDSQSADEDDVQSSDDYVQASAAGNVDVQSSDDDVQSADEASGESADDDDDDVDKARLKRETSEHHSAEGDIQKD